MNPFPAAHRAPLAHQGLSALLFSLLAAATLFTSLSKPLHNWDMIGYIAATKSMEEQDAGALHSFTYEELRRTVSPEQYGELVSGDYRAAVRADASALREQLPFYQIRPLYNGLTYLSYKAGIPLGFATHFVSGVSVSLALLVLYFLSVAFLSAPFLYVMPVLILLFGVLDLGRLSTPDGLAFLGFTAAAGLYLKNRATLLLVLLPFLVCVRTDLILFTLPLSGFVLAFDRGKRWAACASILASLLLYIAIGSHWNNPGWCTLFYFTFVKLLPHPLSQAPILTLGDYLRTLSAGVRSLLENRAFLAYLAVLVFSAHRVRDGLRKAPWRTVFATRPVALATVCLIFWIAHFLAFPAAWDRFFSGAYVMGTLSLMMLTNNPR